MILLVIPCAPVPWKAHAGFGRRSWNPRYEERGFYQWEIKKQYKQNIPIVQAVKINYIFYFPVPESYSAKKKESILAGRVHHIKRPDLSNLVKFVEDTLKEIVIKDDSQVIKFTAQKMYGTEAKTEIEIELA